MILRVMIVEDEDMIRNGLVKTLPWADMGCTVIGSAGDGKSGLEQIVERRPEEFYVSDKGLACKVENTTFLGRYSNYFLRFADGICVPDQPSLEFSQDLGHTHELYRMGDTLKLMPDAQKINVFTADMEHSLIKDVICYEEA